MAEILDTINDAKESFERQLEDLACVIGEDVGLDNRCGDMWVDLENRLIISNQVRQLQYYGGFEYISEENKIIFMDYTIYMAESDYGEECERVISALANFEDNCD